MAVNGQLETPLATTEWQFEVGHIIFVEPFKLMANLPNPVIGLSFLQRNGTVLDMRQGILNILSFSMQFKDATNLYPNITDTLLNPNPAYPTKPNLENKL